MALLLREEDVRRAVTMLDALETTEAALAALGRREGRNLPRQRLVMGRGVLHLLAGSVPEQGVFGFKAYSTFGGAARFAVWLYSSQTGELLAIIEADWLGRLRTGAASGVATKYLAREDAAIAGIYGTGGQAETQLLAVAAVRALREIRVFGRDEERRAAFCRRMQRSLGVPVRATGDAETAQGSAIVITATTARQPVLLGAWLAEGAHLNIVGSNWADRREVDHETLRRAALIVTDDVEQAAIEAGDLISAIDAEAIGWDEVFALGEVVAGVRPGRRSPQGITVFKSLGIGSEDVALAARALERARSLGMGEEVRLLTV